jgi:predicted dehydrogenase
MKWGILSTAKIGVEQVIPGIQKSETEKVIAIGSRNFESAKEAATKLNIPKFYGSYQEVNDDPEVEIIYNPLPNHLHVEWTAKAIEAGKHVLCEKPLFIDPKDAEKLIKLRDQYQVKVGEAFMVRTHPQWAKAKEIIDSGELGEVLSYQATFSYYNTDPNNIRNIAEYGGGALWDIGCYPIMTSRFLFGENPHQVILNAQIHPEFKTDTLSNAIMDFPFGKTASFTVSTQLAPYQRVHVMGSKKEMEILIPFNPSAGAETLLKINNADIFNKDIEKINIPACDQYQVQAEAFSEAVLNDSEVPVPLEDALDHSRIITALFDSSKTGSWVKL